MDETLSHEAGMASGKEMIHSLIPAEIGIVGYL